MTETQTKIERILAPDIARGYMLLLIAVANVSVFLWGQQTSIYTTHPTDGTAFDRALSVLAIVFVDARVYPMFAFLFGYGMVQFARSRNTRGVPDQIVTRMLQRRHLWLMAFGFVHALLLFAGDILGAYGLAGLLLTLFLFWRTDRTVSIVIWSFLGVIGATAVFMFVSAVIVEMFVPSDVLAMGDPGNFGSGDLLNGMPEFWLAMLTRVGIWVAGTIGTVLMLSVPVCILIGWLAARHRWLERLAPRFAPGKVAFWGILIATVGAVPQALIYLEVIPFLANTGWGLMGVTQLSGIAGGIGYAALFACIGSRLTGPATGFTGAVAAVGKRSLTFYLLQSIIFAPLLAAWGFGLGSKIGTAAAFAIAVGVWLISLTVAALLERRNARGPTEVLLRRLTYGPYE